MNIFRTKDFSLSKTEMHRHLKLWDLILLGIGAMMGTGIFTITGTAAATLAGPALVVSIVISAICVSFMLQYTLETWIAFVLALVVGVITYFTYGYKNSTLSKNQ